MQMRQYNISRIKGITGVVLAGGKSSRYGKNKALENMNGSRLIERVVRVMDAIFDRIVIITNTPEEYAFLGLPMYEDVIKGLGPIGGIYTGLKTITDEAGFFVACDMPFLNAHLIRHMIRMKADYDAVVPKIDWKIEALHALYTRACLPAIQTLIDAKIYQTIQFFNHIRVNYVGEHVIRAFDPQLKTFMNINSPQEMYHALQLEE